jgi:hypothetical protein
MPTGRWHLRNKKSKPVFAANYNCAYFLKCDVFEGYANENVKKIFGVTEKISYFAADIRIN